MKVLKGGIGFFTQIPIGRDPESFESLRRNLWILPIIGLISGFVIALPSYFLALLNIEFIAVLLYILVEGINHIDGLADFGDSVFASNNKKFEALKDTKLGSGGVIFIVFYLVILFFSFQSIRAEIIYAIILSQVCAKTAMLVLLTTSKPLWEGLASTMMEFASKRDLVVGVLIAILIFAFIALHTNFRIFLVFISSIVVVVFYRAYVNKKFKGVNGDIIGALNCIVFALSILIFTML